MRSHLATAFAKLALAAAILGAGCSGGSGFSGASAKKGKAKKSEVAGSAAKPAATTSGDIAADNAMTSTNGGGIDADNSIQSDAGSTSTAAVDPANVKAPEWASLVDVRCDFVDMVDDNNVQIRCEMTRTDGQPIPDDDVPMTISLNAPDGTPRAGHTATDAGPGAGLALTGLFGKILHKTVQLITAPVQTIANDVFHVQIGTGAGAGLFNFPLLTKLFDKYPILKDGISLATCLATSGVPAWCFVKFGLQTADRLVNQGGRPDARAVIPVYMAAAGAAHYYTTDPAAPGVIGAAWSVLRDQLPGTREVWLCLYQNTNFFISDQTCDHGAGTQAGRLGFAPDAQREGTQALYRCAQLSTNDQIAVTDLQQCAAAGYGAIGQLYWVPTAGYVHAAY